MNFRPEQLARCPRSLPGTRNPHAVTVAPSVADLPPFSKETDSTSVGRQAACEGAVFRKKTVRWEVNSAVPQVPQFPQTDPDVTVALSMRTANSPAVSRIGNHVISGTGIVVTFCPNNTLRHSRPVGQVADDLVRPVFPAPASTPVAGIIGVAEERFGLRKSPTAPMPRASPNWRMV